MKRAIPEKSAKGVKVTLPSLSRSAVPPDTDPTLWIVSGCPVFVVSSDLTRPLAVGAETTLSLASHGVSVV